MQNKLFHSLRIIWVVALKDISDAIRNKMTLSIMVGVSFMMLSSMALPWMMGLEGTPTAVVYTSEKSTLVRALTARDDFNLGLEDSEEDMYNAVSEAQMPTLGLILPPEFNKEAGSGEVVQVEGVVPHWIDPLKTVELVAFFEQELSKASWQTIQINVEGRVAYPRLDAGGQPFLVAMNFSMLVTMLGLTLVPFLLVEEKETHTMDALLMSPVRLSQLVIGKALAGMFYCLLGAVMVFVFNAKMFVHWEIAILAVMLGSLFAVSVGLLLGSLCENQSSINMWVGLLTMGMMVPLFLDQFVNSRLPVIVQTILLFVPSVATHKLLVYAMAGDLDAALVWSNVAVLAVVAVIVLALVVWLVRRSDK